MRNESNKPTRNGGYLHVLVERPRDWRPPSRVRTVQSAPSQDLAFVADRARRRATDEWLSDYAKGLGLPLPAGTDALRLLGAGCWLGYGTEWLSIPMLDAEARVTGIRLRHRDGRKCAVRGSSDGLMIGALLGDTLLVTEGASDAAAAICAWPGASVLGRPSCRGAEAVLAEHVRVQGHKVVALLADRDSPGLAGALHAAQSLALVHPDVRVVEDIPAKDVRELVRQLGAERAGQVLRKLVSATAPVPIEIIWREVSV